VILPILSNSYIHSTGSRFKGVKKPAPRLARFKVDLLEHLPDETAWRTDTLLEQVSLHNVAELGNLGLHASDKSETDLQFLNLGKTMIT
jgi:hypothetical protein